MKRTAELLKVLGDETRLRMYLLLLEAGDLCSCEIETILDLNQSNASRHLQKLRQAGVLEHYKKAQWAHYRPAEALPPGIRRALAAVAEVARETPEAARDRELLHHYRHSGFSCRNITEWVKPGPSISY